MFDDEYEFDYNRIVKDTDELYDDEEYYTPDYSDEPDYDSDSDGYEYQNEHEFDCYYHNVLDELDYE